MVLLYCRLEAVGILGLLYRTCYGKFWALKWVVNGNFGLRPVC
jgi:hypothetical protein